MRPRLVLLCAALVGAALPTISHAGPAKHLEPPVLHAQQRRGTAVLGPASTVAPTAKVVDGSAADWSGVAPGFSGFATYSHGELVYTDYLFDSFGADDGDDAERVARNDALEALHPGLYRAEPTWQYDVGGELGAPSEELGVKGERTYGDARDTDGSGHVAAADLRELRLSATADTVHVLAGTTTMTDQRSVALVLLADTRDGSRSYDVPFGSGLRTTVADVAVLVARSGGVAVDLATGERTTFPVAADPEGYANVLEAAIPRELLAGTYNGHLGQVWLSVASGVSDGAAGLVDLRSDKADVVNVANVAFRPAEPVRIRFDKRQAFALAERSIDGFQQRVDLAALTSGRTEPFRPGPGYHERHFRSTEQISTEISGSGVDGVWQPYGAYVPTSYDPARPTRLTWWMHWRGGDTHDGAVVSPRIMRDFGEEVGGLVVAPRGRGSSSWYVGKGQVDFREVWDDALATFSVDRDRVYVTGHSMGGWASYLLPILYPDRFAAALPYAGVPTQGLYAGCDFDPCWQGTNGGNGKVQWTYPLLENLRNVPIAISHGALDELVPVSGVTKQAQRLNKLGYQHRYYLFPSYEHYSHPINDEWEEGAAYASLFRRDPNPARVTYVRSMPFERTVETGPDQGNKLAGLNFDFDNAYWMSGLTPADLVNGVATVDVTSQAITRLPQVSAPEVGGPASPGQLGPWAMQGLRWLPTPLASAPAAVNGFTAVLKGTQRVQLDAARMRLDTTRRITGQVSSDHAVTLRLAGPWTAEPTVFVNGQPQPHALIDGVLEIPLPGGALTVVIG